MGEGLPRHPKSPGTHQRDAFFLEQLCISGIKQHQRRIIPQHLPQPRRILRTDSGGHANALLPQFDQILPQKLTLIQAPEDIPRLLFLAAKAKKLRLVQLCILCLVRRAQRLQRPKEPAVQGFPQCFFSGQRIKQQQTQFRL